MGSSDLSLLGPVGLSQSTSSREVWLNETKGTRPWNRWLVDPRSIRSARETETEGRVESSGRGRLADFIKTGVLHKERSPLVPWGPVFQLPEEAVLST